MNKLDLNKIDLIINGSLLVIYNSEYAMVESESFVDENGIKLNRYNGNSLGKIMEELGLVIIKDNRFYELTQKAIEIIKNGGYLKHRHTENGGINNQHVTNTLHFNGNNYGNVGQDSDFSESQIKNNIKNIPAEKPKHKSEKQNEIWDRLKTIAMILAFITAVIGAITKFMELW